ncbi:hypothetical protein MAR_009176 [Mya arenaria]|uniref:Uncharacterized protein n=1 Tax=Mya arenaria TaxID=6604 RepID=A0ABY7E1A3_MYAAR|nr:hypothetical protein MAR_009176 [Mya arenaria]
MTQHFGSGFPVPRNDFTMMNNNYMPQRNIVSFTGRTGQLNGLRSPQILHNTASQPNADLSPNNIAEPLLVQGIKNQSQVLDIDFDCDSTAQIPNLMCDHQGPRQSQFISCSNSINPVEAPVLSPQSSANVNISSYPSNLTSFTFTSPMQSCIYAPALTTWPKTRFPQSVLTGRMFAPTGCSATWQHVVPQRMPWQTTAPLVPNQLGINVFTDFIFFYMKQQYLNHVFHGITQHPHSKLHCPDLQFRRSCAFLQWICKQTKEETSSGRQGLRIHATSPPLGHTGASHALGNTPDIITAANQENQQNSSCYQQYQQQQQQQDFSQGGYLTTQWQNYQDLENRLSLMDEDLLDAEETPMSSGSTQPRLHVNIDSLPRAIETRPVVPKAILDKIMNPCRDLVLWSAPGNKLQEKTDEKGDSEENTVDSAACKAESGLPGQAGIEVSDMADDSMEVEAEYIDEDFDL